MRNLIQILKDTPYRDTTHKFPGLDGAKGLLILLVVMTYCLPQSVVFLIFSHFDSGYIVWPYMISNTTLVIFVLVYIAPNNWFQNRILLLLNLNSPGIYLYHPLLQISIYTYLFHDRFQNHTSYFTTLIVFLNVITGTLIINFILKNGISRTGLCG